MRDPFAGYDNWLVEPYESACRAADAEDAMEEWMWENSTWRCGCCGEDVEYSETKVPCPHCGDTEYPQQQVKPTRWDYEDYLYNI